MINPQDVHLAYQLFLGREPESEAVVNSLCQNTHSIEQLRDAFLKSPEFIQFASQLVEKPQVVRQRHPFHLPRIPVETEVSEDVLKKMFERIHQEWEQLGKTEPHWSVVTQPKYYKTEFGSHSDEFYLSGDHATQLLLSTLRRCGVNPNQLKSCLDIGCGVGRVTSHLSAVFEKVIAVDISEAHLSIAQSYLASKNIKNVELQHCANFDQIRKMPEVDLIYSLITFQHNPPPVMVWMLREVLSHLRSGGAAFIQIPTYRTGYMFEVERYLHSTPPNTMEMHFLPQHEIFRIIEESNCHALEIREDGMVGAEDSMLSNTFVIQKR
jgi:2-polyprenyl-3-methyl-5-hydroxy-6-metoxy-1,4-benzoquinol methylase